MSSGLSVDRLDDTLVLTLNEPATRNALSVEIADRLQETVTDIDTSDVRCVVIQGSGSTFCSGIDREAMLSELTADTPVTQQVEDLIRPVSEAIEAVTACSVPTVAKVDGPAFGVGGSLAIAADVVLASDRGKIGFGFRQFGLSAIAATSALLPRAVSAPVAKELVFTGELLDATRASDLGLFNRVFPADEFEQRSRAVIDRIASGPSLALQHSKQLLEAGRDRSVSEAIDAEAAALEETLESADHREGLRAFASQREPEFTGQ